MREPLAIVQARMASARLPGKMLLDLAGRPLIEYAWGAAAEAFGAENVVVATTARAENWPLREHFEGKGEQVFVYEGPEEDVLGRFYECAHTYRWHPDSVIVRVTPDDPYKNAEALRKVAAGYRLPVEWGGEAFTLRTLSEAHDEFGDAGSLYREHITNALFPVSPPQAVPRDFCWTIDTREDLEAVRRQMGGPARVEN